MTDYKSFAIMAIHYVLLKEDKNRLKFYILMERNDCYNTIFEQRAYAEKVIEANVLGEGDEFKITGLSILFTPELDSLKEGEEIDAAEKGKE